MIDAKLSAQITQIVESQGYILFDIEVVRENDDIILRVCIHKDGGILHSDCQKISEILSPLLDVYEPFKDAYLLEVSSPGIERNLTKPQHFRCFLNQKIQITLNDKSKICGILSGADEAHFTLDGARKFAYSDIKKAKSVFEWK